MILRVVFLSLLCIPVLYLSFVLCGQLIDQIRVNTKKDIFSSGKSEKLDPVYRRDNIHMNRASKKRGRDIKVIK